MGRNMLSKTTLYMLKALSVLGKLPPGSYLGANAVALKTGIPMNYLGKMLRQLAKSGYVVSQKGLGGGFRISSPPDKITLLEIIETTEHEELLTSCFWGNPKCSEESPCPMHEKWKAIVELTSSTFQQTTIADIMEKALA